MVMLVLVVVGMVGVVAVVFVMIVMMVGGDVVDGDVGRGDGVDITSKEESGIGKRKDVQQRGAAGWGGNCLLILTLFYQGFKDQN